MPEIPKEYRDLDTEIEGLTLNREPITRAIRDFRAKGLQAILDSLEIKPDQKERIVKIRALLKDKNFLKLVKSGHVTFGMIKPEANEAKFRERTDEEVAKMVLAEIGEPLKVLAAQNFFFPLDYAADFYGHLADRPEVFTRVSGFMAGGAVTGLVLFNPNGNAVEEWRRQMGSTNPKNASPDSLRARFADTIENNVLHGSDSIQSVQRELKMFEGLLRTMCA